MKTNTQNEHGILNGISSRYNNLCSILYGWYDQVPGLIGNVERVRYSSGLNATGGPSAKKDGSMVGLEVFFYQIVIQ